ncbi:hypothetical protein C5167_025160 [Papaver somniferum]|uniref:Uncharacterized protein n=1 Tax=Papaver somniferum TaxID=3469 RepID=A0A4Y7JUM8_PAPSO|nr:hypothetical protein C5167_025160 [Papaver somniferum]
MVLLKLRDGNNELTLVGDISSQMEIKWAINTDNAGNFFNDNPTSDKSKVAMIVITFERGSCKYYISSHGLDLWMLRSSKEKLLIRENGPVNQQQRTP